MNLQFLRFYTLFSFLVVAWLYMLKQLQAFRICLENPAPQSYRGFGSLLLRCGRYVVSVVCHSGFLSRLIWINHNKIIYAIIFLIYRLAFNRVQFTKGSIA
jgi:hypothetical protein